MSRAKTNLRLHQLLVFFGWVMLGLATAEAILLIDNLMYVMYATAAMIMSAWFIACMRQHCFNIRREIASRAKILVFTEMYGGGKFRV